MSAETTPISDALLQYLVQYSVRENQYLEKLKKETLALPGGKMMAAPEQAQFIGLLIKLMNAKRVIEIGTFTGYTTLAMALALPKNGIVMSCDVQSETTHIGQKYWHQAGVLKKIQLFITPGLSFLDELVLEGYEKSIDLAFIDADKKNNQAYFEKLITLMRPGGLIIIDNVLWHGRVVHAKKEDAQTQAIHHFNDAVYRDDRIDISIIPLGDGMTLASIR